MILSGRDEALRKWCQDLENDLSTARTTVVSLLLGFRDLAEQADDAVIGMDFRFLFDEHRQVFHIGYNASTEQLDPSYYDLLASESPDCQPDSDCQRRCAAKPLAASGTTGDEGER